MMDAYAAWHIFEQTGKVEDYIRYSQMKSLEEFNSQEAIHADQHRLAEGSRSGNAQDAG